MTELSTITIIQNYLTKLTKVNDFSDIEVFTTLNISNTLNMSRTLVSQYLNYLFKENKIVKVSTRPVYYFQKDILEKKYNCLIKENEFISIKELEKYLLNSNKAEDFQKAIGYYGSLEEIILKIKSAICYPNNGLPIVLTGEKGVGKSYLVSLVFEFLKNNKLISKNSKLLKLTVTNEKTQKYGEIIFGSDKKLGILSEDIGLLYIKNCDLLDEFTQLKLANFLTNSTYSPIDSNNILHSSTRIIIETSSLEKLSEELALKIPVVCEVANYENRFDDEKERFIKKFFNIEQIKLQRKIFVSQKVIETLKNCSFHDNLNGLSKIIKNICASKYSINNDEEIKIELIDLPIGFLENNFVVEETQQQFEEIKYSENEILRNDKTVILFKNLLDSFYRFKSENSLNKFIDDSYTIMRNYFDFLIFEDNLVNHKIQLTETIIFELISKIRKTYNINLPLNCSNILSRVIYYSNKSNSSIRKFEMENIDSISEIEQYISNKLKNEYIIASNIIKAINSNFEINLSSIVKIFLTLNVSLYNKDIKNKDTIGIIVTHGYSTATSIAEAVNTLSKVKVFEAINMPLDTTTQQICEKINDFIEKNPYYKNIILMVDMGSLENIGNNINGSINLGIINNISTFMALNIATKMLQNMPIEEILSQASLEAVCKYKIFSKLQKQEAIVFTSDVGIKVSRKLCQLFEKSINKEIDLKFLEYDYDKLMKNKTEDILFKKYNVLLLVNPYTLKLNGINQVSLEDIINYKDIDKVNNVLSKYLDNEEIDQFNQVLLKNFSLESIMENITILNANILLDFVSEAINNLQQKMNKKFKSKTLVGMYIHICFLLERLVTKNAIDMDVEEFTLNNQAFIECVNSSFELLLNNYNVTLPISEIAYLYDYIKNDEE